MDKAEGSSRSVRGLDQRTESRGGKRRSRERDRQTKKQTNKEPDRQRDHQPGTGRQAGGSPQRRWRGVAPAGRMSVSISQGLWGLPPTGSTSIRFSGSAHSPQAFPRLVPYPSASQPCPITAIPLPGHLSDLPFTRHLRETQTLPVGFGRHPEEPGQSSRHGQDRQGSSSGDSSQACRRESAARPVSPRLARLSQRGRKGPAPLPPPVPQPQTKQTLGSGSGGEWLIYIWFASHLHVPDSHLSPIPCLSNCRLSPAQSGP